MATKCVGLERSVVGKLRFGMFAGAIARIIKHGTRPTNGLSSRTESEIRPVEILLSLRTGPVVSSPCKRLAPAHDAQGAAITTSAQTCSPDLIGRVDLRIGPFPRSASRFNGLRGGELLEQQLWQLHSRSRPRRYIQLELAHLAIPCGRLHSICANRGNAAFTAGRR